MNIHAEPVASKGIRFSICAESGHEIARAFLYILHNDLHKQPFGFMEDVFVDDRKRGLGLGTILVTAIIKMARQQNCYKLIATSRHTRPKVHELYKDLGFEDHGNEFRITF